MQAIGIIGGTFNPVHNGHLQFAQDFSSRFKLDEVRLIPCALPAHRELPEVSGELRLNLLELAALDKTKLSVDACEVQAAKLSNKPSYTINTLRSIRSALGEKCVIYFAMGVDAFESFESWHQWQDILKLVNIVVVERPGYCSQVLFSSANKQWLSSVETEFKGHEAAFGRVYLQTLSLLDISSTSIRKQLFEGKSVKHLLPDKVAQFIQEQQLYSVKK